MQRKIHADILVFFMCGRNYVNCRHMYVEVHTHCCATARSETWQHSCIFTAAANTQQAQRLCHAVCGNIVISTGEIVTKMSGMRVAEKLGHVAF